MINTYNKNSKSNKIILLLNSFFRIYVYFTLFWLMVKSLAGIEIPIPEIDLPAATESIEETGSVYTPLIEDYLSTWKIFRNIGYMLAIGIFAIQGVYYSSAQLDPDKLDFVTKQFKRTILYLILLSFSYAIARLSVDLVYIAYFLSKA